MIERDRVEIERNAAPVSTTLVSELALSDKSNRRGIPTLELWGT